MFLVELERCLPITARVLLLSYTLKEEEFKPEHV